ncbi:MAG: methyltransferase [Myxococcales bacterium]|nr:methyltransferase [Myxococcales bacterium]
MRAAYHTSQIEPMLTALGAHLLAYSNLWRPLPFAQLHLPWQDQHPELAQWLNALPQAEVESPHRPWLATAPPWLQNLASDCQQLGELGRLDSAPIPKLGVRAARRISGRKVKQIEGFCAVVLSVLRAQCGEAWRSGCEIVDWCAGKGHMGRWLVQQTGGRLLALEKDPHLVEVGQKACDQLGLVARFVVVDVREPATAALLTNQQFVVALHACGDLHAAMLTAATQQRVEGLALAPCCYNSATSGPVLSAAGHRLALGLTRSDVDLVHRQIWVAAGHDRAQAEQEQAWRLGFDALQRQSTGHHDYRPMPPFPKTWLSLDFSTFCHRFAQLDGLQLPSKASLGEFEQTGWLRLRQVQRLELLRGMFRAPLETWLVLDRAQMLVESGYHVQVGTFCGRLDSPRNAMVVGWL